MQVKDVQRLDTLPDQSSDELLVTPASIFSSMRIKSAPVEYMDCDCDGGCDDGNIDDY